MLKFGNKEFRNLQEQVDKNMKDILFILQEEGVLNEFGIKVVGQEASIADMPTVEAYKASHEDWSYGDAYAIGTEAPYELYILTRANGTHASDYWFNIGEFPVSGPQGPQGETGPQGPQGQTGRPGADGTSAGFGTVTATAVTLEPSEEATVNVITSGTNVEKNFAFTFGIPKGKPGETPAVEWGDIEGTLSNQSDLVSALQGKQNTLVSGTNIKTINNESILGSGNINIETGGAVEDVEVNGVSVVDAQGVAEVTVPTKVSDLTNDSGFITSSALSGYATESYVQGYHDSSKQDTLVSGTNIKTINNESILGSGNIVIQGGGGSITDVEVNGTSVVDQEGVAKITVPTATSDLTNDSGFINSSALSGYATKTWVGEQGYLTSVSWNDVSGKPTFATVATSGSYNDLSDKPTIPDTTYMVTTNTEQTITGVKTFSNGISVESITVADVLNVPSIQTAELITGTNDSITIPSNKSGTIALISDIPSVSNMVTTNTMQEITAIKHFKKGLTVDGEFSSQGSFTLTSSPTKPAEISFDSINSEYTKTLSIGTTTDDRTIELPDKSGTIALISDIPSVSNIVTTDTAQTITGVKTLPIGTKIKVNDNYYYEFTDDNFGQIGFKRSGQYGVTLDGNTVRGIASLVPQNNNTNDLGISSKKWRDLYLGGALKDGTNSISIADIQPKLTAGTGIAISNNVISSTLEGIDYEVDDQLPATGKKGIIYLIPNGESGSENIYDEYIWIPPETSGSTGRFEFIGTTQTDLSNYVTLNTKQTISGRKIFTENNSIYFGNASNPTRIYQDGASIKFGSRLQVGMIFPTNNKSQDLGTNQVGTWYWRDLYLCRNILGLDDSDNQITIPVKDIALTSELPTKTSDLLNDSGFQTASDVSTTLSSYSTTSAMNTAISTAISSQTKETWTFTLSDGTTTTKTIVLG